MMKRNQIRIIGGAWRGRKIQFPTTETLRPTPDRVRETVFNWLAPYIREARCLDLFAGSGALGLEALSRGASEVVFVERDKKIAENLKENIKSLQSKNFSTSITDTDPNADPDNTNTDKSHADNNIVSRTDNLRSNATVIVRDAIDWLKDPASLSRTGEEQFDIIFVDPPYAEKQWAICLSLLEKGNFLKDKSLVYIEADEEFTSLNLPRNWEILKEKRAGHVFYGLLETLHL